MQTTKPYERARAAGNHAAEADCWADFDDVMAKLVDYFGVLREVTGWYIQPRAHVAPKQPRIDRILTPKKALRDAGWDIGPVGVECKKSGEKLGPAISQAIDYGRAVFPISGSCTVNLEWIFLWPSGVVAGDIGSIMAQQRIGHMQRLGDGIEFGCGDGYARTVSVEYGVHYRRPTCGYKVGSR